MMAIGLDQIALEGEESGTNALEPSNDAASTATQVEQRLKAAGYPVEIDGTAPPMVGNFDVSFEGGPTEGGYAITAYVYESAQDASANVEELMPKSKPAPCPPKKRRLVLSKLGCMLQLRVWWGRASRNTRQVHQGRRGCLVRPLGNGMDSLGKVRGEVGIGTILGVADRVSEDPCTGSRLS